MILNTASASTLTLGSFVSGGMLFSFAKFAAVSSVFDRVRCVSVWSFWVRNWCGWQAPEIDGRVSDAGKLFGPRFSARSAKVYRFRFLTNSTSLT